MGKKIKIIGKMPIKLKVRTWWNWQASDKNATAKTAALEGIKKFKKKFSEFPDLVCTENYETNRIVQLWSPVLNPDLMTISKDSILNPKKPAKKPEDYLLPEMAQEMKKRKAKEKAKEMRERRKVQTSKRTIV